MMYKSDVLDAILFTVSVLRDFSLDKWDVMIVGMSATPRRE